jgi:MoaA/NifB/PqqE/SkfB family radical SAM enzyme
LIVVRSSLRAVRRRLEARTPRPVKTLVRRALTRVAPPRQTTIEFIAADIVNNCNLRCPFCLVDYGEVKRTDLMTEETFRALIRLAPAVPDGGFWLSCLHEPTLHPKLGDFIELIPQAFRKKFWFTTNLTRPLPEALVTTLAASGLHHLNVSFDSRDESLFAVLRKHGRLKVFLENLERLLAAFERSDRAPAVRYITMAYRSNMDEIPALVSWMNEHGSAAEVEIRYTFNTSNIPDEFKRTHFMHPDDWTTLRSRLETLRYTNWVLLEPPEGYDPDAPQRPVNWFDHVPLTPPPHTSFPRPMRLRARPDGRLHPCYAEDVFAVKVTELDDPVRFFADISVQPRA